MIKKEFYIKIIIFSFKKKRRKTMYKEIINEIRRNTYNENNVKEAAEKILSFSHKSFPVKIIDICHKMGFQIYRQELPEDICGYITIDGELKEKFGTDMIISVNTNESNKRRRFTVAHELAHYLFDFNPNENIEYFNQFEKTHEENAENEIRANRFAAELLMPEEAFIHKYEEFKKAKGNTFYDIVQQLSDYFLVPPKAIERRLIEELRIQ